MNLDLIHQGGQFANFSIHLAAKRRTTDEDQEAEYTR
jgi:hypothetical protein